MGDRDDEIEREGEREGGRRGRSGKIRVSDRLPLFSVK